MENESVITLDLHSKNVYQARIALDAALRRAGGAYRIHVVHGYRQGNALCNLVRTEYAQHKKVLRILPVGDGATEFILREI